MLFRIQFLGVLVSFGNLAEGATTFWSGTITTSATNLAGSVDYLVDTENDVMTLSNHQGDWATAYGPSQTVTLYALNDLTSNASQLYGPTASTQNVTNADFEAGAASGLGAVANDGWYWASTSNNFYFHLAIGADDRGLASPLLDFDGTTTNAPGSAVISYSSSSGSASEFGFSRIMFSSPVAVPEPQTSLLFSILVAAGLGRRKRALP